MTDSKTSQNSPFTAYQQALQTFTAQWSTNGHSLWQGQTAFWETVGSIMQQRTTLFTQLAQGTPAWQQKLLGCTSFPQFVETYSQWVAESTARTSTFTGDVFAQRTWLWQQWQQLASRNGSQATSTFSANAPAANTFTQAASPSALQATVQQSASLGVTSARPTLEPIFVPELVRQKTAATPNGSDAITDLLNRSATTGNAGTTSAGSASTHNTADGVSRSAASDGVSRSATQAVTASHSASARRSVIASRKHNSSRRFAR